MEVEEEVEVLLSRLVHVVQRTGRCPGPGVVWEQSGGSRGTRTSSCRV